GSYRTRRRKRQRRRPASTKLIAFFDLDGTLEDSRQDMALSINRVRETKSLPALSLEVARSLVNRGMDALTEAAFPEIIENQTDLKKVRALYEEDYLSHVVDHTRLYDGISSMLQGVASIGRLVVYTNKPERISRELLKRLQVLETVSGIIGGDSFPESKPSPIPMQTMADRLGETGARWMTGDTAADMQAARNSGARSIWASWGYISSVPEPSPDFTAKNPSDVLEFIRN
ncbi:MAG TPA: HAD-IA family hydrolase, partial [Leptospiraceae bacterium]|nr:HAD-IA family hydrolase [Leptospiraceae bacterium]